ncbi:putative protein phosphatase-7 [Schistosoma mansoni]|uniref:putative protein phosphatase-7 n=1 Tax=Schistosoma mansoni TaxID=6183 RepID=UPI00022DC3E7|nr:putative protein phosphatase-7 [Schistosoma mansoni]|eukprot:XP_018649819.1 putative protein phosphatase-7 [Schistosoma mansoni]
MTEVTPEGLFDFLSSYSIESLGAALLIQKWYRRYQARLEVKRRCAWMIYQTLEYAGEQNHAKLYNLFHDLISYASNGETINTDNNSASPNNPDIDEPLDLNIWNGDWLPPIPSNYQGIKLHFPIDMNQVAMMMESFVNGSRIHARYVFQILCESRQCIMSRPNIQMASTSISRQITVVGDLHGQFSDLQIILYKNGMPDVTNPYVFNGDFVDRGRKSVETLLTILCLMLIRPTSVFINRGNHEDLYVNCHHPFRNLSSIFVTGMLVKCFAEFYRYIPVATLIDDKIFVCHGGISDKTDLSTLGDLNRFSYLTLLKPVDQPISNSDSKKQYQDLLWSDPQTQSGLLMNERRGLGCSFGPDITNSFLNKHNLSLLIRSHECKPEGFEWSHNKQLLTIFSASNYYTDGSNRGAIARISVDGSIQIIQYVTGGQKKFKTLRQKVSWAEESALTDLKNKIAAYSTELKKEFQSLDPTNTGRVTKLEWCKTMEKVLDLKLPWSTLQPRLVVASKIPHQVEYLTTFQKLTTYNTPSKVPPSVTEEMYKFRDVLEGIFRAMDKDNSGRISLNEFKQACLRLPKWTKIDEQIVMDMARSIDINKDGLIDFNEFLETFRLVESDHDYYESLTEQQTDE